MATKTIPNVNLTQALKARVNWAHSRIPTYSPEDRAEYKETAEYNAWLGGYTSFPNRYVPALVQDVPELRRMWADGLLQREVQELQNEGNQ